MSDTDGILDLLATLRLDDPAFDPTAAAACVIEACVDALPIDGAAIVWMTEMGPGSTLAATDERAGILEELQFGLGEGPCIESSDRGRPELCPDLRAGRAGRWPAFAGGALRAGVAAVFAFPLQIAGIPLGVLDLYRQSPGELSSADVLIALTYAGAATGLLMRIQAAAGTDGVPAAVVAAVDLRASIHQATGMVVHQASVDPATALALLRARAFALERSLDELASDVLTGAVRFG